MGQRSENCNQLIPKRTKAPGAMQSRRANQLQSKFVSLSSAGGCANVKKRRRRLSPSLHASELHHIHCQLKLPLKWTLAPAKPSQEVDTHVITQPVRISTARYHTRKTSFLIVEAPNPPDAF